MDKVEDINAQLEGARASVSVYWLAVAVYLLVYLFPVPFAGNERVFKIADEQKITVLQQDPRPSASGETLALAPSYTHPANEYVAKATRIPTDTFSTLRFSANFDARGPPAFV